MKTLDFWNILDFRRLFLDFCSRVIFGVLGVKRVQRANTFWKQTHGGEARINLNFFVDLNLDKYNSEDDSNDDTDEDDEDIDEGEEELSDGFVGNCELKAFVESKLTRTCGRRKTEKAARVGGVKLEKLGDDFKSRHKKKDSGLEGKTEKIEENFPIDFPGDFLRWEGSGRQFLMFASMLVFNTILHFPLA